VLLYEQQQQQSRKRKRFICREKLDSESNHPDRLDTGLDAFVKFYLTIKIAMPMGVIPPPASTLGLA
jgi:hypothetical protein